MIYRLFIFMFIGLVFPSRSFGQDTGSIEYKWEIDAGGGLFFDVLLMDKYRGFDMAFSYQFDLIYYKDKLMVSPFLRLMPEYMLLWEESVSHYEFGLRAGGMKDLERSQFSFLLGMSYMFGNALGTKKVKVPNSSGTAMIDDWVHLDEAYSTFGLTTEFSWKKQLGNKVVFGLAVPISVNSWYVITAPHLSLGLRL